MTNPLAVEEYPAGRKYFEHYDARTVDEARLLLKEHQEGAKIISGGVDIATLLRSQVIKPKALVNIKTIEGLRYIETGGEGLRIGALTTLSGIVRSALIREAYPALAQAAASIATPQLRNMSTVAGNLCQEVRCWYYRRSPVTGLTFHCRRKGGKTCYAIAGDNRYHAILDGGQCWAASPSDLATALIALGAALRIVSPASEKVLPLEKLYSEMGITLQPDELITEIQIPRVKAGAKQRFIKFRERKAIDFALSSVAAVLALEGGVVSQARIVLGGVAPTPYRAIAAEAALSGKAITGKLAEAAADAAISNARPLSRNSYKVPLTRALVRRAIAGTETGFVHR